MTMCQLLFLDESFVLVSNFCKISYENLRESLYSGDIDISYLSVAQQTEQSENKEGPDSDEDVEGEGESTGSDPIDGDETEKSSDEQLSSSCESDAELMSEEENDS